MTRNKIYWMTSIIVLSAVTALVLLNWQRQTLIAHDTNVGFDFLIHKAEAENRNVGDTSAPESKTTTKTSIDTNVAGETTADKTNADTKIPNPIDTKIINNNPASTKAEIAAAKNSERQIIGFRSSIKATDHDKMQERMTEVWADFHNKSEFHAAVKWNKDVEVYAIYEGLNKPESWVTIGYPQPLLDNKPFAGTVSLRTKTRPAKVLDVDGQDIAAVVKAWESISWTPPPRSVTEIYRLNPQGSIMAIQLEVRY
ncbi:Uncharacterised protein [BD1-7 clade bacterium]|uniref:Uncharacterized protein n=1 Tax=BD1-7 clade bacterium TaxID=2029982 RepID=A0A5S9Q723_9GAMM|nr:Uncharacterised protein [BD1-7 clade bacterium]